MPKQESRNNNHELPALRISGATSMRRMHWNSLITLSLMAIFVFASAGAQETHKTKPEPLIIQEHGRFAVGRSVITAPCTFDPIKQGAYNPGGIDPAGQNPSRRVRSWPPRVSAAVMRLPLMASSSRAIRKWGRTGPSRR
jgi:hypothetical protein